MIITTFIIGILGILIFTIIVIFFQKLLENNESGFLHLLMTIMFACWLPIPLVIYVNMNIYDFLLIGTIFGTASILLYILTMLLQASHLSYSSQKYSSDVNLWDDRDKWMINGLLGGQVELFAGILKGVWTIFLTVSFWLNGQTVFFIIGIIYSTLTLFYLSMLLNMSINKEMSALKKLKLNNMIINIETSSWFAILLIWLIIAR